MKKLINKIVLIPSIPFALILAVFVYLNIIKHTSVSEMHMRGSNNLLTDDIKKHIDKIYPKGLRYLIAVVFYAYVLKITFF